jgi:hypothetical protein
MLIINRMQTGWQLLRESTVDAWQISACGP